MNLIYKTNRKGLAGKRILNLNILGFATIVSLLGISGLKAFPSYLDVTKLNGLNGFSINAKVNNQALGYSVHAAGDMNGDGYDDVIVASRSSSEVAVIFGKAINFPANLELSAPNVLDGIHGFSIVLPTNEKELAVSGGGDVNGDGYDDVIIGSPKAYPSLDECGFAYVVFGRPGIYPASLNVSQLNGTNGFRIWAVARGSHLGFSVAIAKDINNDGYDEMVLGAPDDISPAQPQDPNDPAIRDGRVYVIMGKQTFPDTMYMGSLGNDGFIFSTEQFFSASAAPLNMRLGWAVSGAGDVNHDGFNDILVGAPRQHGWMDGFSDDFAGATYVVLGSATLPQGAVQSFRIEGDTKQDEVGRSVGEAGDVNGDGMDDFLVGSPLFTFDASISTDGAAYLLLGNIQSQLGQGGEVKLGEDFNGNGSYPDLSNGAWFNGGMDSAYSARSISGIGDINGDGLDEVLIGSPTTFQGNGLWTGESWVVFGRKTPYPLSPGIQGYTPLLGPNGAWAKYPGFAARIGASPAMGWSVSEAGDVNGDGLSDMIIGAPNANTPNTVQGGRAYVIFGKLNDPGDIDGNGYVDLIVQMPGYYGASGPLANVVYAAFMNNGVFTGKTKTLLLLALSEKVVATNDFDLDGVTDFVTQNGTQVNLRKGPTYAVSNSFNLPNGVQIFASGNLAGQQVLGKLGYPDLLTFYKPNATTTTYYILTNLGNGNFSNPNNTFYTLLNQDNNWIVGTGKFINSEAPLSVNKYDDVLIYKTWNASKPLWTRTVADVQSGLNEVSLTNGLLPNSLILGTGNFLPFPKITEAISVDAFTKKVYIGIGNQVFSGYTLPSSATIAGPK